MDFFRKVTLVLLEPSAMARMGFTSVINTQPGWELRGATDDLTVARRVCQEALPDILLLNLESRRGGSLALLSELVTLSPQSRAIVVTDREDSELVYRAFRSGARGLLSRLDDATAFLEAVRIVLAGDVYASQHSCRCIIASLGRSPGQAGVSSFSNREFEIFACLGRGLGPKTIAGELGVSVRTVETHQARMKEKLALASCSDLARYASRWRAQRE